MVDNFQEKKDEFTACVGEVVDTKNITQLVINFEQTGVKIIPVSNWTFAMQGTKQIDVIGIDNYNITQNDTEW